MRFFFKLVGYAALIAIIGFVALAVWAGASSNGTCLGCGDHIQGGEVINANGTNEGPAE